MKKMGMRMMMRSCTLRMVLSVRLSRSCVSTWNNFDESTGIMELPTYLPSPESVNSDRILPTAPKSRKKVGVLSEMLLRSAASLCFFL
jgi:hypothetical protein